METANKILEAMKIAKAPVSAGQLVEMTGIDRKEIDKAMKKLKTDALIVSPKNCYWEPA